MKNIFFNLLLMVALATTACAFEVGYSGQLVELSIGEGIQIPFSLYQDQKTGQKLILQIDSAPEHRTPISGNVEIDWNSLRNQFHLDKEKILLQPGEIAQIKLVLPPKASIAPGFYGIWIRISEEWPRKKPGQEIQTRRHQTQRLPVIVRIL